MRSAVLIACVLATASTARAADERLSKAKDLYASAAYEDALTVLDDLGKAAPVDAADVDEYRAFCLYALGRSNEADAIFASLMKRDPAFHIEAADASPRVEAAFAAVRKRVLPDLIRDQFRAAREAFDKKSTDQAQAQLLQAKQMLAEAHEAGTWDDTLSDLQVLIDGFLDLNGAKVAKAAAPAAVNPTTSDAAPKPAEAAAAAPQGPREYGVEDKDVTPPIVIRQPVPPVPAALFTFVARRSALLEVHIDQTGAVQRASLRRSLHPVYDARIVEATREWQYRPAIRAGVPVPYVAFIEINVNH